MSGEAMSLNAKIRNLARKKDMSAQVVLQGIATPYPPVLTKIQAMF